MTVFPLRRRASLTGYRAIVTGADVGLGYQTALGLARRGAEVTLGFLDLTNGERAGDRIRQLVPTSTIHVAELDLSRSDSVRKFAALQGTVRTATESSEVWPLDILVNNAGISGYPPRFTLTSEGLERTMTTNYLGHFALTAHLWPALRSAPSCRVVSLSSMQHLSGDLSAMSPGFLIGSAEGYDVKERYATSKLACTTFAMELDRRAKASGIPLVSVAAHPGTARTFVKHDGTMSRRFWRQDAFLGARSQLRAATDPSLIGGEFIGPLFHYRGPAVHVRALPAAYDVALGKRLWAASEEVAGISFAFSASGRN